VAKFTDATGDDWLVEVTVFHVERVRRDVTLADGEGVNLNDAMVGVGKKDAGDGDEQNLITRLDGDPALLVAVLYSLRRPGQIPLSLA
jgi:hypothetical protein